MRYGAAREISHKYTRREAAIDDAQELNQGLEPNSPVLAYCVRPRGARWGGEAMSGAPPQVKKHPAVAMQQTEPTGRLFKGVATHLYVCPVCGATRKSGSNGLWMCNGPARWARNTPPEMVDWRRVG